MKDRQKISRAEARRQGLETYYTGEKCNNGHICARRVHNWTCIECNELNWRRQGQRRKDKEKNNVIRTSLYGPCPCDDCAFFKHCQQQNESCSAFACYVFGERWRDEPKQPSKRMHGYVFDQGDAA